MFKSLPSQLNRREQKDENIKKFNNYLDRIKAETIVLDELIKDYNLDAEEELLPQIEEYLERNLTDNEKQTIEFAIKAIRDLGYRKGKRFNGKGVYSYSGHSSSKKKK